MFNYHGAPLHYLACWASIAFAARVPPRVPPPRGTAAPWGEYGVCMWIFCPSLVGACVCCCLLTFAIPRCSFLRPPFSLWDEGGKKRGILGIYHHVSTQHLQRYVDELRLLQIGLVCLNGITFEKGADDGEGNLPPRARVLLVSGQNKVFCGFLLTTWNIQVPAD